MLTTFTLVVIATTSGFNYRTPDIVSVDHIDGFVSIEECQSAGHALSGVSNVDKMEWRCILKNVRN